MPAFPAPVSVLAVLPLETPILELRRQCPVNLLADPVSSGVETKHINGDSQGDLHDGAAAVAGVYALKSDARATVEDMIASILGDEVEALGCVHLGWSEADLVRFAWRHSQQFRRDDQPTLFLLVTPSCAVPIEITATLNGLVIDSPSMEKEWTRSDGNPELVVLLRAA